VAIDKEFEPLWDIIAQAGSSPPDGEPEWCLVEEVAGSHDQGIPVDEVPPPVLGRWLKGLGLPVLAGLLTTGAARTGPPVRDDAEEEVRSLILELSPPPRGALWQLLDEARSLLPRVAGKADIDVRVPQSLFATRVVGDEAVSWRSGQFGEAGGPVPQVFALSGDDELLRRGAVRFADGVVHVQASLLPADGQWRLFCLSLEEGPSPFFDERELLLLHRVPGAKPARAIPAELVLRGYLADGWHSAVALGWEEPALRCLLLVLFARLQTLLEEAARDIRDRATAHLELITHDVGELLSQRIAPIKQRLIEKLRP
jgi:hypothetical protein